MQTWQAELTDDNRYLVTTTVDNISGQGALTIWSCTIDESGTPETQFKVKQLESFPGQTIDCALAPDNRHLAFIRQKGTRRFRERELYLYDLKDLPAGTKEPRLLANNIAGAGTQMIDFTPDSRQMLVVDANRFIVTYDVQSGQKLTSFPTLKTDDTSTQSGYLMHKLSPDGTKLAMGSRSDLGVDLWDCKNRTLLYSLPEQEGIIYHFAWSPDGRRLAVSRSNGDIDIWNIAEIERVLADLKLWPPVNNGKEG